MPGCQRAVRVNAKATSRECRVENTVHCLTRRERTPCMHTAFDRMETNNLHSGPMACNKHLLTTHEYSTSCWRSQRNSMCRVHKRQGHFCCGRLSDASKFQQVHTKQQLSSRPACLPQHCYPQGGPTILHPNPKISLRHGTRRRNSRAAEYKKRMATILYVKLSSKTG